MPVASIDHGDDTIEQVERVQMILGRARNITIEPDGINLVKDDKRRAHDGIEYQLVRNHGATE